MGAAIEQEGPLTPCVQAPRGGAAAQAQPWGIEIATAFSKKGALGEFGHVKQDHADILGSYDPILIEQCDLHVNIRPGSGRPAGRMPMRCAPSSWRVAAPAL